jgi:hypothetical protein
MNSEFIVPSSYLNKLRLKTRYLEAALWSFRDQRRDFFAERIKEEMLEVDKYGKDMSSVKSLVDTWEVVRKRISILGTFLNRLSSYWFWSMKLHLLKNNGQTEEWRSSAPVLSDFIENT